MTKGPREWWLAARMAAGPGCREGWAAAVSPLNGGAGYSPGVAQTTNTVTTWFDDPPFTNPRQPVG
jgi:hypothetical protein